MASMVKLEGTRQQWAIRSVARHQKWGFEPTAVAFFGDVKWKKGAEAKRWCKQNCGGKYKIDSEGDFYFEDEADAMMFWLVFNPASN